MTEDSKYLDNLFQSKFAAFEAEPPASVWENVHKELHGKGGGSINPVNLAVLAALMMISGLLGFSIMKDSGIAGHSSDQNIKNNFLLADYREDPGMKQSNAVAVFENEDESFTRTKATGASTTPDAESTPEVEVITSATASHSDIHGQIATQSYSPTFREHARLAKLKARRPLGVQNSMQTSHSENIIVRDSKFQPKFAGVNDAERRYHRRASWQMGLYFMPSVGFLPDDSIPNQRNYTFDLSLKWKKREFFVETGIGISYSTDDGQYDVDYERYLGSYEDVYNMTFDTIDGEIVPTYYTQEVDVYDTVSRYKIEKTQNRYTYLQVPLLIGFHKQFDRFGWFVKGGPVFNFLINSNIPEPEMGDDRIVSLDQQMPGRVNTHWQLSISAGMTYQLSNKVSLSLEPTFRYYLNSQYERKYISTRHPYSVGLRTGLLFNF